MALASSSRQRLSTVFGWITGVSVGLLVGFLVSLATYATYPRVTSWSTFVFVVIGSFGGMRLADRLGEKGFRPLGIAAGLTVAVVLTILAASFLTAT